MAKKSSRLLSKRADQYIFEKQSERSPVEIIFKFLDSFVPDSSVDGSGEMRQSSKVERYVLEALAKRLYAFAHRGAKLDVAFGGKIGRQLQDKRTNEKAHEVAFEIALAKQNGATNDEAIAQVAPKLNMSSDTVRDLYKRAGPNGARKRGGNSKKNPP